MPSFSACLRASAQLGSGAAAAFLLASHLVATPGVLAGAPVPGLREAAKGPAARWSRLAETPFQRWGKEQGMPPAVVTALAQDGDGFFWIGTQSGLVRWDGNRFVARRPDPKDPHALPGGFVQVLHADADGRLWVGTASGGLSRYEPGRDRFLPVAVGPGGISHPSVKALADDGRGGLWVGTEAGLDRFDPATGAVRRHLHEPGVAGSLPGSQVLSLLRGRDGVLWIGTDQGLARLGRDDRRFTPVAPPPAAASAPRVARLFEAGDGRIWVGTETHGAFVFDPGTGTARAVGQDGAGSPSLSTLQVTGILEVRPGVLWISTYGQGIFVVDASGRLLARLNHDPLQDTSLAGNFNWAMLADPTGMIWVGGTYGLSRHDPGQMTFLTLAGGSRRPDGVSNRDVGSVLITADGLAWLGVSANGVDILDPGGARVGALRPDPARAGTALPSGRSPAMAEAGGGGVYLGTDRGLYLADPGGRTVRRLTLPGRDPATSVRALHSDGNRLWVGSWDDGLRAFDVAPGRISAGVVVTGLSDKKVRVIAPGPSGSLWVGTWNGLNRYDPATATVEPILADPKDPAALSSGNISSLLTDRQGRLWVGTLGGGICILEGRDATGRPRFRRLGPAEGLPGPNIGKLLEDGNGKIWGSTVDGLVRIDPVDLSFRVFQRADGVIVPGYWVGSGAATAQGELLFGGLGGLTVVLPGRLQEWRYRPPVVVTEARVGGVVVPAGRFNGAGSEEPLVIAPDANSLVLEFSALDYSAPAQNRLAYRLDGYDRDWVATDATRRLAAYTNLPPGGYLLRMRGSNRAGIWTERELRVPVRVLPAWYQTWWFRTSLGVLGLGAVLAAVQSRTAFLRRQRRELEAEVARQTVALQAANRDLEEAVAALGCRNQELASQRDEITRLANHDALTGLPTLRLARDRLAVACSQAVRTQTRVALLFIDLDGFKLVNDAFGHDAGDHVLRTVAARLEACLRGSDTAARQGGDEFIVLVSEAGDEDAAGAVAARIVASIAEPIPYAGQEVRIGSSIGVALFPDHVQEPEGLLRRADEAMYSVKRSGKNGFAFYRPG